MSASTPQPFRINIPDEVLDDLRARLDWTRLPGEIPGSGWDYGTNRDYLIDLIDYWRDGYDWRKEEAKLNALPQFVAKVDALDVHFVHARGKGPNPLPLLILHGWPGSFAEMAEVIGPLSDPGGHGGDPADAFDVVVPSLVGYGFSAPATTPGMSPRAMAGVFATLMTKSLGYQRFGAQGGDWGSVITCHLARYHAQHLAGIHLNMLGIQPPGAADIPLTETERAIQQRRNAFTATESAYMQIQGTKPQTLAYALNDSPAGLAAWIVEKFRAWSDCGGEIERSFTRDQLLTNIMLYWVTGTIGSSVRLYYEMFRDRAALAPGEKLTPPAGFANFPGEPFSNLRPYAERALNLVQWTDMPRGGHFGAMEEPELFVEDVRAFFRRVR